jgi:ATP-dependent Clp protease ATP-binding subunit ClpA
MFERFNSESRQVLERSQAEARRLGHDFVGCEHFLLALSEQPAIAPIFSAAGLDRAALEAAVRQVVGTRDIDANALAGIGIDISAVREIVERSFGVGALEAAAVALNRPGGHRRRPRRRCVTAPRTPCASMGASIGASMGASMGAATGTSMGLRLSANAKEALSRALQQSRAVGSTTIDPEHLASGFTLMETGSVPRLLLTLGVDRESIRRAFQRRPGS